MTEVSEMLKIALRTLIIEAYVGPEDPRMTWFTDNEEGSGFIGTLARLDVATALRPFVPEGSFGLCSNAY